MVNRLVSTELRSLTHVQEYVDNDASARTGVRPSESPIVEEHAEATVSSWGTTVRFSRTQ